LKKVDKEAGIVSYGVSIPKYRIKTETIAEVYGKDPLEIKNGLKILEKTVPAIDEDTITLAANAARQAWWRLSKKHEIGAIYIGSESHPYAVKSSSSVVGDVLGISPEFTAADLEFACKAGTAGIQMVLSHVQAGRVDAGIAIGADTAQGAPGDALEFSAASASAAFVIGEKDIIARIVDTLSFTTDTPDFWRREHQKYPAHGGRFTGQPAYFKHIINATNRILEKNKMTVEDFNHIVFHMPNGKFPVQVAKSLKVSREQLEIGLVSPVLGNSYSACSLVGLARVLDNAKPREKILLTSYGSGAGSDSFILEVTDNIMDYRKRSKDLEFDRTVQEQIDTKIYLNYGQYVRNAKKLK
jgi:hydroxymethylglutaryl-CoA synthase